MEPDRVFQRWSVTSFARIVLLLILIVGSYLFVSSATVWAKGRPPAPGEIAYGMQAFLEVSDDYQHPLGPGETVMMLITVRNVSSARRKIYSGNWSAEMHRANDWRNGGVELQAAVYDTAKRHPIFGHPTEQQALPNPIDPSSPRTAQDPEAFLWLGPGDSVNKHIQLTIPSWMARRPGSYEVGVAIAMGVPLYEHSPKGMPEGWRKNPDEKEPWPSVWVGKVITNLVTIEVAGETSE